MQPREVQVEIDQRGHQVGLTRPHRQTEKIIRVDEVVQKRVEEGIPVFFLAERIILDHLGQFFQFVRLGKAVNKFGRGISAQPARLAGVFAQCPRANDLGKAAVSPDELEPKVDFDGFTLGQAKLSCLFDVNGDLSGQRLGIPFLLRYPGESSLLD